MSVPQRDEDEGGGRRAVRRSSKYWRTNWLMTYSPVSQTWVPIYTNPLDCPPPVSSGALHSLKRLHLAINIYSLQ